MEQRKSSQCQHNIHRNLVSEVGIGGRRVLWPALDLFEKGTERERSQLSYGQLSSQHERCVGVLERTPAFLELHSGEHCHCCYAGDGDGEAGEGTGMVLLGLGSGRCKLRIWRVDIHGDCKNLTCCFRGVSGDYPVCFEGYACCEACKEGW